MGITGTRLATAEWMSAGPAAHALGITVFTLYRWAGEGHIREYRTPGGHRRFRVEDIRTFLERQQRPA